MSEQKQMSKTEALNIVAQACAGVSTTLQQHQLIQGAIQVLKSEIMKPNVNIKNPKIKDSNVVVDSPGSISK